MESTAHQLAMLYISKQDMSKLTPVQVANKYREIYDQIYKVLLAKETPYFSKATPYTENRYGSY